MQNEPHKRNYTGLVIRNPKWHQAEGYGFQEANDFKDRVFLEKSIIAQPIKMIPPFAKPEGSSYIHKNP
jgi:hypothetical protein